MGDAKSKVFVVRPKELATSRFVSDGAPMSARLVRAKRHAQVASHIAQDFEVAVASADEMHALGKEGVEIEDAAE